jgi:glycosyltransferase involved in cell wall biosynthesis
MKILLGCVYYEPAWAYGGPPKLVFELARRLVQRGHAVTVCTTDALDERSRAPAGFHQSAGVDVVRFRNVSNRLAYHAKIFTPLGCRGWLREHVSSFDVVHLFDARTPLNGWAAEAAIAARVPFFLSVWGQLPPGDGWRAAVKSVYDHRYLRHQLARAAGLLAQNDHEAQLYREHGASAPIALWPLAVDLDEIGAAPARGAFRARHGIGADERVVLFVGRIHALKGLDPLLHAFARAAAPKSRLVIVGRDDGDLRNAQSLAHRLGLDDRVLFTGALYGADVMPAYVDADLFCITPTHFEETSLASLTACAAGHPVLISDRCGIPWLEEFDAGRTVAQDVEAIAGAMRELLADPQRLARMGANARRLVDERFSWPSVVAQVEALYEGAAERSA